MPRIMSQIIVFVKIINNAVKLEVELKQQW